VRRSAAAAGPALNDTCFAADAVLTDGRCFEVGTGQSGHLTG
jgi:hypothetical protein